MTLDRIRLFILTEKHGNITQAAHELHISQSAASRQLKVLEDNVQTKLFKHSGRGIQLTGSGEIFLNRVLPLWNQFEELEKSYSPSRYSIIVAASYRPSKYVLPMVITEFSKKHPTANITLWTRRSIEIEKLLLDSKVDLAITTNPAPNVSASSFVTERYCSEPLTAFVAVNHPLAKLKLLQPADMGTIPVIIKPSREGKSRTEELLGKYERGGFKFKAVVRCDSSEVIKEFVRQGAGVGFLYYNSIRRSVENGYFKVVHFPGFDLIGHNYIVYLKQYPLPLLARQFLAFLRASIRQAEPITPVTTDVSKGWQRGQARANALVQKVLSWLIFISAVEWVCLLS